MTATTRGPMILHITSRDSWERARPLGRYEAASLETEGFVHCSTPEQIQGVVNHLFRGQSGLVLLGIDTNRVKAEVRYENCEGGSKLFPHVYGPIEAEAVVGVWDFVPGDDGLFGLPPEVGTEGQVGSRSGQ